MYLNLGLEHDQFEPIIPQNTSNEKINQWNSQPWFKYQCFTVSLIYIFIIFML